jgi:D-alanine transaminase
MAGALFCFDQHMARLERSLAEVRIRNPHTPEQWRQITSRLIADFDQLTLGNGQSDASKVRPIS